MSEMLHHSLLPVSCNSVTQAVQIASLTILQRLKILAHGAFLRSYYESARMLASLGIALVSGPARTRCE